MWDWIRKGQFFYATGEEDVIVTIGLEDVVIVRDRNVTLIQKRPHSGN